MQIRTASPERGSSTSSSISTGAPQSRNQPKVDCSPRDVQPYRPSVGRRLAAFRVWVNERPGYELPWTTQLLAVLPDVETVEDAKDWLGALSAPLCEASPDLLSRLSERLSCLLAEFTPEEVGVCVKLCLDIAWSAKQSELAWANLCAGLHRLKLPAMQALLTCLQQEDQERIPEEGRELIDHVNAVAIGMSQTLPQLGFAALVVPVEIAPVSLHEGEIIAIGTGDNRHAIRPPGATANDVPMVLDHDHDALMLTMAHLLRTRDIDWMRPRPLGQQEEEREALRQLLAVFSERFCARFGPMLANYKWMEAEATIRGFGRFADGCRLQDRMGNLIHRLVNLSAPEVMSMLPCAPGVARRRLDLLLRNFMIAPGYSRARRGRRI